MHQVAFQLRADIDDVSSWRKEKFERWVAFLRMYLPPKR